MLGGKSQASQRPTALGTMLQASTYGMAIPTIYGTTRAALLAIWAQNLRTGGSDKKSKKKGVQTYVENIDFLVGSNPIEAVLQMWSNTTRYGLDFKSYRVAPGPGVLSVAIPDSNFYKLIAVTAEVTLVAPITFNDFGCPGPVTCAGGGGSGGCSGAIGGTSPSPQVIALSPKYVPGGGFYGGLDPVNSCGWPASEFVVGRIRGNPTGVWQGIPSVQLWNAGFTTDFTCCCLSPLPELVADAAAMGCTGEAGKLYPGSLTSGGPCSKPVLADGTGQIGGNIFPCPATDFGFNLESLGFSILDKTTAFDSAQFAYGTGGSTDIGPFTHLGATFPGPGTTGAGFSDGHNFLNADGGCATMLKFHPISANGVPLHIIILSGVQCVGAIASPSAGIAPGWTLLQAGKLFAVMAQFESAPAASGVPLWNAAQHGPDLINPNYVRQSNYKWDPNLDAATVELLDIQSANPPGSPLFAWNGFLDFFYAAKNKSTKFNPPPERLRLTWEPQLADGPEYGTDFIAQQIEMPEFAGLGSPDIDLGAAGVLPSLRGEFKGTFAKIAPRGDAEFADMIEDIIKSGQLQLGAQLGLIQRGVNANELPGPVQKNFLQYATDAALNVPFRSANAASDLLIAFGRTSAALPTIADDAANVWTVLYNALNMGFWYASAKAAEPGNTVHLGNGLDAFILEIDPGFQALDNHVVANGSGTGAMSATINVANNQGQTFILGMWIDNSGTAGALPFHWNNPLFSRQNSGTGIATPFTGSFYRIVQAAGNYTVTIPRTGSGTWTLVLMAFKAAQPVPYPVALGKIIDEPSLSLTRAQCQAYGLWGSLTMDAQQSASDWLEMILKCANADPVWSGFKLKMIPRAEASFVDNGAVYTSPTASGPVYHITENDLVGDATKPLVTVTRKAQVDANNVLQAQIFDRNADYNQSNVEEPLAGASALYGPRINSPVNLPAIVDPIIARKILQIEARRYSLLRKEYAFTLQARFFGVEAKDLVSLDESKLGFSALPLRLTSVKENENLELECVAEDFICGCHVPGAMPVTGAQGSAGAGGALGGSTAPVTPVTSQDPGSVNAPLIFEPPTRLSGQGNQGQIWIPISGSSPNYGGCQVLISTDGGASYNPAPNGQVLGNCVTGEVATDWPAAADPDTTNDLLLDLTESLGVLNNLAVSDEDNFVFPCVVSGGLTCIPYELMTYAVANLIGTNSYVLQATGGGTNKLRRAVYGCPQPVNGVDHPAASKFALLNPSGAGLFKIDLDPKWIGQTIFFKFLAFNLQGNLLQDEASATAYSFAPTGCPSQTQNPNVITYTITGGALTNPTSTTIDMTQATGNFPSNTVNYNARVFTITAPTAPTTYYVTVYDPGQIGDTGTGTTLSAFADTTATRWNTPGYVRIGTIVAQPAGGGSTTGPGGSNPGAASPLRLTFVPPDGTPNTNVTNEIAAPAGTISRCVIVTKQSDATTDLQINIKKNGTTIFTTQPVVAHGTATGTVNVFTGFTATPVLVSQDDVFTIDVVAGTSSWKFTVQLES